MAERQGIITLNNRCLIDIGNVGVASSCSVGFDRAQGPPDGEDRKRGQR